MPIALLITLVGVMLSGVLASVVSVQIVSTRSAVQSQRAIDAAQAGLDIAVGHIRAANDGTEDGVLSSLPCGPFTGGVGQPSVASYDVTIVYKDRTGAAITCLPGGGTGRTPTVAQLRSTGTDRGAGPSRTLNATYQFRTTNRNIPGGLIHVYRGTPPTTQDLCFDAGSRSPGLGDILTVQPCSPGSEQQSFAYNPNLTLTLVTSPDKCLQAGQVPHTTSGVAVTFQLCGVTTQPSQQWSFNDLADFEGTSDGATLDGYCFNVQAPDVAGSPVTLNTGAGACDGGNSIEHTFNPEARVGAGAAGPGIGQLVNYAQFGRCLDVTIQVWTSDYMIVWPCKQSPDPAGVLWNQRWQLPPQTTGESGATGLISTKPASTPFRACLKSPASTALGKFVTLEECPSGTPGDEFTWTVFGDTGKYATSYRIKDGYGNCLAAADQDDPSTTFHYYGDRVSTVVVATCSESTLQKWNAEPDKLAATPLKDIRER
jgi:hypothetical protein